MKLGDLYMCVECDEVFQGAQCPACAGTVLGNVGKWMAESHKVIGELTLAIQEAQKKLERTWKKTGGHG